MPSFLQKLKKNRTETDLIRAQMKEKEEAEVVEGESEEPVPVLIDMSKNDKEVVVVAHVPGAVKKNVKISLEGESDILAIEGENYPPETWQKNIIKTKREEPAKAQLAVKMGGMRECKYGKFYRKVVLPEEVIFKKTNVSVSDGMILVLLPLFDPNKK